jgi:tRNA threonylcarbamoyladenosine biosynthesis protein TsaE
MKYLRETLPDADATVAAGARLARGLRAGMVITLSGELGAGKTTLVRGALRGLGWTGPVKSPTYTLVEHYVVSSLYFYHFDFYRLGQSEEWGTTGFSDYFRPDAICAIEWPERVESYLQLPDVSLRLFHAGSGRELALRAHTPAGEACLSELSGRDG